MEKYSAEPSWLVNVGTSMARTRVILGVLMLSFLLSRAMGAPPDPAARGLDAFVHGSTSAASGASVRLDVETFGFEQVTSPNPVGGVAIDAVWDPLSFGEARSSAPPAVHAESDASGRAILVVPMPEGDSRDLTLLVGLRLGAHARTRVLTIARTQSIEATLHVADAAVVPGATVNAWVHVTHAHSDEPIANAAVDVNLYEGSYARTKLDARTDLAGMALVRVPVPSSDDPTDKWELRATAHLGDERATSTQTLSPRDETPGSPFFDARFDDGSVRAGAQASFTILLRDATSTPVAGAPIRYWVGQNGLQPPSDDEGWLKASTSAMTDLHGEIHGKAAAPVVVSPDGQTQLRLVARGTLEGQKVGHEARVPVSPSAATAWITPDSEHVVPGIEQPLFLRVRDGLDKPIVGTFDVEGDGLHARVTTDGHGDAELTWRAPESLGAFRDVGPCAGGVAASVRVRAASSIEALRDHPEPFALCVPIDRDARAIVVPEKRVVRSGELLKVHVLARDKQTQTWSVTLGQNRTASTTTWIDGVTGGSIAVPAGAAGVYELSVASPVAKQAAHVAHTSVLVLPSSIPHLEAKITSGRITPGATVEVDAALTDEAGKPLVGTVTAMLVDLEGGGSLDGVLHLDTRERLCRAAGAHDRCADLLSGESAAEPLRRALLGPTTGALTPQLDPGASVTRELDESFSEVLHSLEGAVYSASLDPDRLVDVRRKSQTTFSFNPELMTLTTAAMDKPPLTPGGETLTLGDLAAIDAQVTFDNVARRVTRFKLFKVLQAVRAFKTAHALDVNEPALRDPNALVRRLVRSGDIGQGMLVDPWGGSMQFVKSAGPPIPFLAPIAGFELRAPGPNGVIGDADDIRDPFGRVVKSGSPYARAMSEDELVDAKLDMEVADATVSSWSSVMDNATGTHLGSIGLIGHGEGGGGTGQGFGSGHGTLRGGSTRVQGSLTTGDAFFQPPQRTDAQGHVHFSVPLGDIETTWGLGLLGLPDHAPPAATKVEIVASQPVSLSANAGAAWTVGDEMDVRVLVRNRTKAAVDAGVTVAGEGAASLPTTKKTVHVGAESIASFAVRVRAPRAGEAVLSAKLEATGLPSDALRYSWNVLASGELVTRTAAQWVEGTGVVKLEVDRRDSLMGRARIVLTRGGGDALEGALSSVDPDLTRAPDSIADAMEVAARIERLGPTDLRERAASISRTASERVLAAIVDRGADQSADTWLLGRRLRAYAPADFVTKKVSLKESDDAHCPPGLSLAQEVVGLAVLPPSQTETELPCWETFVAEATAHAVASDEPTTVARALLALSERPERARAARSLAERLRALVRIAPSGAIQLERGSRSDRTLVYAALLRGNKLGSSLVSDDRLVAWIAVDRDANGSFGSPEASRAVVRALTAVGNVAQGPTQTISIDDHGATRSVILGASGVAVLGLGDGTTSVVVHASAGVVARLERPMLRSFSHPPDLSESPLRLEVKWPDDARAGHISTLHITMSSVVNKSERAVARIPLPPGVSMVAPMRGVNQVHGALLVTHDVSVGASATIDVPLRFSLGGHATVREARIVTPRAPMPRGIAPAQSIVIR